LRERRLTPREGRWYDEGVMRTVTINNYIIANPDICHGKPVIKGTRVMVWQILEMLENGASVKEILDAFPSLTIAHVKAALSYAADLTKGSEYVLLKV